MNETPQPAVQTVEEALADYDQAVLRFWNGSDEDIDLGREGDSEARKLLKQLDASRGHPQYKSRNWNEIVAPARTRLIAAIEARSSSKYNTPSNLCLNERCLHLQHPYGECKAEFDSRVGTVPKCRCKENVEGTLLEEARIVVGRNLPIWHQHYIKVLEGK